MIFWSQVLFWKFLVLPHPRAKSPPMLVAPSSSYQAWDRLCQSANSGEENLVGLAAALIIIASEVWKKKTRPIVRNQDPADLDLAVDGCRVDRLVPRFAP